MNNYIEKMVQELETEFVDQDFSSRLAFKPQFISNNYKEGRKVLASIEDELSKCDGFYISVAFITLSGLTPLLQILKELEEKGVRGKILTTDYLNFTQPRALNKLAELKNIELKMYYTDGKEEGFHTKGYIFKREQVYKIIIGSSNITLGALTKNKEWNTKVVSKEQSEYVSEVVSEFEELWNSEKAKRYEEFINRYTVNYEIVKRQKEIIRNREIPSLQEYRLKPNKMQIEFITNLRKLQEEGEKKALLISATGERVIIVIGCNKCFRIKDFRNFY